MKNGRIWERKEEGRRSLIGQRALSQNRRLCTDLNISMDYTFLFCSLPAPLFLLPLLALPRRNKTKELIT